jgi:hypothetical protein
MTSWTQGSECGKRSSLRWTRSHSSDYTAFGDAIKARVFSNTKIETERRLLSNKMNPKGRLLVTASHEAGPGLTGLSRRSPLTATLGLALLHSEYDERSRSEQSNGRDRDAHAYLVNRSSDPNAHAAFGRRWHDDYFRFHDTRPYPKSPAQR